MTSMHWTCSDSCTDVGPPLKWSCVLSLMNSWSCTQPTETTHCQCVYINIHCFANGTIAWCNLDLTGTFIIAWRWCHNTMGTIVVQFNRLHDKVYRLQWAIFGTVHVGFAPILKLKHLVSCLHRCSVLKHCMHFRCMLTNLTMHPYIKRIVPYPIPIDH